MRSECFLLNKSKGCVDIDCMGKCEDVNLFLIGLVSRDLVGCGGVSGRNRPSMAGLPADCVRWLHNRQTEEKLFPKHSGVVTT